MKTLLVILGSLYLMLSLGGICEAKSWRGIVPLKSTRADVERLLGQPGKYNRYQFENERVSFDYSTGKCNSSDDCVCRVPTNTVLTIRIEPEVEMKFSKLKLDRKKYKQTKSGHLLTVISYSNDEEGLIFTVDEDEVTAITYLWSAKDCNKLEKSLKSKRAPNKEFCSRCGSRFL